jgi:hypothetical protein
VPASSLTAVSAKISPPALRALPFAPGTTADTVVAIAGGTTTSCPSPDPATYQQLKKNSDQRLTNKIIVHTNSGAELATRLPGEGNSRAFAAPAEADLVPPEPVAFTPSDTLLDPGAADFAASVGWLPPGAVAFAVPCALFGLASGSLMTARRFCVAS